MNPPQKQTMGRSSSQRSLRKHTLRGFSASLSQHRLGALA